MAARPGRRAAARSSGSYLDDTLVLETTFVTDDGTVQVTDCMPIRDRTVDIVRVVEGVSGRVPMHMDLDDPLRLRLDRAVGPAQRRRDLRAVAGPDAIVPAAPRRARTAPGKATVADFVVEAGDTVPFVLAYHHVARAAAPHRSTRSARDQGHDALVAQLGRSSARTRASGATP